MSWQTGRTISQGSGGGQTQSINLERSKMSGLASQVACSAGVFFLKARDRNSPPYWNSSTY